MQTMELLVNRDDRNVNGPKVETVMRPSPLTITPWETLSAAQAVMRQERLHQLPVVENGVLVGILAERDLHAHSGYLERTKVDAAMTCPAITVAPQETASNAARLLIQHEINALPVVQDGRLVGIVTRTDLLFLLVTLLERA